RSSVRPMRSTRTAHDLRRPHTLPHLRVGSALPHLRAKGGRDLMTTMLDAAHALAAQGWPVFPCWPHGAKAKAPMTAHGLQDATCAPTPLQKWWGRLPHALIGAALPESLIVLDLAPRHGGTLDALEAVTGPLPATLTVWSGRGDGG